jgi:hypothetical protein
MCGWCGDASWTVSGWWWMVPLIGFVLCMMMCMVFRSRMAGRRFCCWGGTGATDLGEVKKEIKVLKDEMENFKTKKENGNG